MVKPAKQKAKKTLPSADPSGRVRQIAPRQRYAAPPPTKMRKMAVAQPQLRQCHSREPTHHFRTTHHGRLALQTGLIAALNQRVGLDHVVTKV
jgi:hypothetical protein